MMYNSTRDRSVLVTAAEAIARGISEEGGLFVPEHIIVMYLLFVRIFQRIEMFYPWCLTGVTFRCTCPVRNQC